MYQYYIVYDIVRAILIRSYFFPKNVLISIKKEEILSVPKLSARLVLYLPTCSLLGVGKKSTDYIRLRVMPIGSLYKIFMDN